MRILITGVDGYLGWSLALSLGANHDIFGIDNCARRRWVNEVKSDSALPILSFDDRIKTYKKKVHPYAEFVFDDITAIDRLKNYIKHFKPDTIVHFAEMPSGPYSMIDYKHCIDTMNNNINGTLAILYAMRETCPDAQLIKLGSMGCYGQPNIPISEGDFEVKYKGFKDKLPFPMQPGSFYHLTKVHDANNIRFACKTWGLTATDIMQGVVYGTSIPEMIGDADLDTRFDFDECFGTAINRFVVQAIVGHPLTVFGEGNQSRGFLPLVDSMQCIELIINNAPQKGKYRVINQFQQVYNLNYLAKIVKEVGSLFGLNTIIEHTENVRQEKTSHFYNPEHDILFNLGYIPSSISLKNEIKQMFNKLIPQKECLKNYIDIIRPKIKWNK